MGVDEGHAAHRVSMGIAEEVRAAAESIGEIADDAVLALDEAADRVAESTVPHRPPVTGERSDLVEPCRVPRLGDDLGAREYRVGVDVPQDRWIGEWLVVLSPRQHRCEIEPEAVDVHVLDPVAQAVQNHPTNDRVVGIEGVADAAVIDVAGWIPGVHEVVRGVVDSPHRQRRTGHAVLGGVVVHDVQDHFDVGAVQRLDHVAELVDGPGRLLVRAVGPMRCEERHGLVAPVVGPAP